MFLHSIFLTNNHNHIHNKKLFKILSILIRLFASSFTINRQHKEDGSSCGSITVEDIEGRMQGLPLLKKTYEDGAEELREHHKNLRQLPCILSAINVEDKPLSNNNTYCIIS